MDKHCNLEKTIAKPGDTSNLFGTMQVMACHHSKEGNEEHCVGWIENQLGVGNNIALRIRMMSCENIGELKTIGEQHQRFEDTLPDYE